MNRRTLYHVTPSYNAGGIQHEGVSPKYSRGRMAATYWVTEAELLWAVYHVSARHHTSTDHLIVFSGWFEPDQLIRTGRRGVFRVDSVVVPNDVFPIGRLVDRDVM